VSGGLVVLSQEDSATFAARRQAAIRRPLAVVDDYLNGGQGSRPVPTYPWAAYVWPDAIKDFLSVAGVNLTQARAEKTPVVRDLPPISAWLATQTETKKDSVKAPNVIAILEGSDPGLKSEHIVFSAHMDHIGIGHGRADSVHNGADDNASGTAGLIALAKAFSQPGARPRRSLIFLVTSGGAKESSGASFFVENAPIALDQIVTNINVDMIGREAGDSITVNGLRDLEFAMPPSWVAGIHPELHLTLVDGGSISDVLADHSPFIRRIVPSLYFHNGDHEDDPPMSDSPAMIDAEQEARILRLVFYVAQTIANTEKRPVWSTEGRRARRAMLGQ
jgi:hypothetical protein